MGGRKRSIKFKILALVLVPLVSLLGIWAFAATITIQSGLDLLRAKSIYEDLVVPAGAVASEVQRERYESLTYLGSSTNDHGELEAQRIKTDQVRAALERKALSEGMQDATDPLTYQRVTELITATRRLPDIRARVDSRNFTRLLTLDAYRLISGAVARVYDSLRLSNDVGLSPPMAITLIERSREFMSEQAALLAGTVGAGSMTAEERNAFASMVIKRRQLYDMGFQLLDDELRQPYLILQNSPSYIRFASVEDQISQDVRPDRPLPGGSVNWGSNLQTLTTIFDRQNGLAAKTITDRAAPVAAGIMWRLVIAGGLGLFTMTISLYVCVRFGRRIAAELVELQNAALELAHRRLPMVVHRLRLGEDVDVSTENPPIPAGTTEEIISVGEAFTSVQTTAIEAAVGQAEIRKGVSKVFLNLARRNQSLLHRQLSMLDTMERRVTDPELLDELFGLDHLTTRMRRHAEGLIILSGAVPGRGWRTPVPLYDVVRAAVEEVEDYLRVHVTVLENMALSGSAATDVIHLVAELVENATIFSPPHTHVEVRGEAVARGFIIEVEDRGLGMSAEEMDQINHRLANPPEFDLADSDRLGLFVVGRLATRRGIRVSLRPSPYGGVTAIVLIPEVLVTQVDSPSGQYSVEQINAIEIGDNGNGRTLTNINGNGNGDGDGDGRGGGGTEANLPHRVRQANLAPQLRENETTSGPAEPARNRQEDPLDSTAYQPSTEMFTSFRAGWQRAHEGEEEKK